MKNQIFENLKKEIEVEIDGVTLKGFVDTSDVIILSSDKGERVSGTYLGRWSEYSDYFDLKKPFKGNGYMFLSGGAIILVPEWHSLAEKMKMFNAGVDLYLKVIDVKTDGTDKYISCSVFQLI